LWFDSEVTGPNHLSGDPKIDKASELKMSKKSLKDYSIIIGLTNPNTS